MFEKKSAVLASVILLTLFGVPLAANAATPQVAISGFPTPVFSEDEDEYEDEDEDGDDDQGVHEEQHEVIPPVITVPGQGKEHHRKPPKNGTPIVPEVLDPNTSAQSLSGIDLAEADYVVVASDDPESTIPLEAANPNESKPIDVKLIRASIKTPADRFMDSAYLGIGILGAAALGLGAVAGVRSIRMRRNDKSDYFYDNQ
ncbi:MAG: hypothetical protein F2529_05480 [Actinobacteria bacterium]|uniref:Unannotated protein n=1 Tax=freshwater metagenome TaxID=449393 RepID=A0A6J6CGE7_9ZZZZ|nr:hypothetical protein [Actinomycetota bacterium]